VVEPLSLAPDPLHVEDSGYAAGVSGAALSLTLADLIATHGGILVNPALSVSGAILTELR